MHPIQIKVITVVIASAVASFAWAGTPKASHWAQSLFDEQGHDFGAVARGGVVRHPFVITNRLTESVSIVNVRASCGCTTGQANVTLLEPGQQGIVTAQMDTRNFVGHKATTLFVSIMTASKREAEVRLAVSSEILSDIVLNPGYVNFGTISKQESTRQTVTIERLGAPDWRATRMFTASRVLTANLVETGRTESGVTYTLTVGLKPETPPGFYDEEILIQTNDRESPKIPVRVMAQVGGDLTASPSMVALGNIKAGGKAEGKFLLKASKPFNIVSVEGAGEGFEIRPLPGSAAKMRQVVVAYEAAKGQTRGDLKKTFRVQTDLPNEPALTLTTTLHIDP